MYGTETSVYLLFLPSTPPFINIFFDHLIHQQFEMRGKKTKKQLIVMARSRVHELVEKRIESGRDSSIDSIIHNVIQIPPFDIPVVFFDATEWLSSCDRKLTLTS